MEPGGAGCVAEEPAHSSPFQVSLLLFPSPTCSSYPLLQVHNSYLPENTLTCPVRETLPICEHEEEELVHSKGGGRKQ